MGEPPVFKDKISKKNFSQGVGESGTGGAGSHAMGKHFFFAFRLAAVRLWESMVSTVNHGPFKTVFVVK